MRDNENDGMSEPPGERSEERGAKNAEEWAVERRDVGVTVILLRDPSRSESLKERRRERVSKSSPLPLPFSKSSPQSGLPPYLRHVFFHKNNDQLWLHPTVEGPYGLKSFYRQSWEPCIPLEPGTHFPVEIKKKIIYQEPFGTDSIF